MCNIIVTGLLLILFSCGGKKNNDSPSTDDHSGNGPKTDTIKIPAGPVNKNPGKTEYATFTDVAINDSVNTVHAIGVQLAMIAFKDWMDKTGAELHVLERLNYLLMAKNNKADQLLDERSYVAKAGELPKVADEIRKEMKEKFGINKTEIPDEGLFIYSFLFKNLRFAENLDVDHSIFRGKDVYYIHTNDYKSAQCEAHYYAFEEEKEFGKGDFIVELFGKDTSDKIYIAQLKPEKTLNATWKKVNKKISGKETTVIVQTEEGPGKFTFPHRFSDDDYFSMPAIDLEMKGNVPEMEGTTLRYNNKEDSIMFTRHYLYFRIDNYGIILIEETEAATESVMPEIGLPPLRVHRPFLIALKRHNAPAPYFLAWISNTSVMIPYSEKKSEQ